MHTPQVSQEHYYTSKYLNHERWASYWHQIEWVRTMAPRTILEVGPGNRTVTAALQKTGFAVTTADIAPDVRPDVIASITALPFAEKEFDLVLAAEVLEHLPFDQVSHALKEMGRVARHWVVLSLPHAGYVFSFECKLPLLSRFAIIFKLPFFWKKHQFNGEHYWELGKYGYSIRRFCRIIEQAGFSIVRKARFADDPAHYYFLLEKQHD